MKAKLRKITIDNKVYLYRLQAKYYSPASTINYSPAVYNKLTVRIYLANHKTTPLIIEFKTIDDYYMGQPLNVGIPLPHAKSGRSIRVNINHPFYIRELILLGLKNGWTGNNNLPVQNGLEYLTELDFDVSGLMTGN